MIPWYVVGLASLALAVAASGYIVIAWRKAPKAFRAMKWLMALSLSTGLLAGVLCDRAALRVTESGASYSFGLLSRNPCSPDGLPAADLGKAIVLTNQQHADDPWWVNIATVGSWCSLGPIRSDDRPCEEYSLARHAMGFDLTSGETRKCIPYEEAAEICGDGAIPKDSSLCKQAFDFQRRRMSP